MNHTCDPGPNKAGLDLSAVVAALELPGCACEPDLSCPCGEACLPGYAAGCHICALGEGVSGPLRHDGPHVACRDHCPHCSGDCECPPLPRQDLCHHVRAAAAAPALNLWLAAVLDEAPRDGEARQAFVLEQVGQLLLGQRPEEYREPPHPPLPLLAKSWEGHVAELGRRHGRYRLFGRHDEATLDALRLTQDLHRARNGSVVLGVLRVDDGQDPVAAGEPDPVVAFRAGVAEAYARWRRGQEAQGQARHAQPREVARAA